MNEILQHPILFLNNYIINIRYRSGVIKTLEIKAWRDRQQKINLNFRAVGLQGAWAGAFESVWYFQENYYYK